MKKAFISTIQHLQWKLTPDSSLFKDLSHLNPFHKGKDWTLNAIRHISAATVDIVVSVEVSFIPISFYYNLVFLLSN